MIKKEFKKLFPNLPNGAWGLINLNNESQKTTLALQKPKVCEEWIRTLHAAKGIEYSYGGYLEDRSHLWRNHYNKQQNSFIHLGVDFNIPVKTEVALILNGKVEQIFYDKDEFGGWGGRVLLKVSNDCYLLYGHLSHNIPLHVGKDYTAGTIVGRVGETEENGGWYPHLHVQVMDGFFIKHFENDLKKIDGYLPQNHPLLSHVANPLSIKDVKL